jgi:RimJ/RimL family protein N-acetyltransferase
LGIKRLQDPIAEVCINGNLAPFSQLLMGTNKSILIPIADATANEISIATAFNYNNEQLKLNYLLNINNCKIEAYLISNNNNIIGYLVLINNWINILITKEFQNRGIGTAMIGLAIEMHAYRNYPHNPTVYIKILYNDVPNFIYRISKKLQFTNEYTFLSRKCRIKNDIINNKHITTLSSNLILNKNGLIVEKLASYINKYMIEAKYLQFVHLSYSTLARSTFFTNMLSTGSRFDNEFLLKGAELKSAIKFLSFKYISYNEIYKLNKLFNDKNKLFDKEITEQEIQDNQIYKITNNISNEFIYLFNKNELLNKIKDIKNTRIETIEKLKNANYYGDIDAEVKNAEVKNATDANATDATDANAKDNFIRINEYYPPFLLDGRLMALRIFAILYISGNGLKKCYIFDKYQIVTAKSKYSIEDKNNWNDKNILQTSTLSTDNLYNWPEYFNDSELKSIIKNNTLEPFIKKIAELLIKCEYLPRSEANSGFTEFFINIKFIKKNGEYYPIINELNNTIQSWKFTNMTIEDDILYNNKFSEDYYKWVSYTVIFPHFGISKQQQPMAIDLSKPNSILNLKIISLLSLDFYKKDKRDKIHIYYDSKKIGYIDLILHNFIIQLSHIELDKEYQKKGIAINVIYLLMDMLAAYYAPNRISLKFLYTKEMYSIAYKLLFHKIDNFFIRECRL